MNEKAQAFAETAKPANNNGGDRRSESFQSNNYNSERHRGTSAEYLTSVIARDHPDIHEAMKQGKYRSVRAAAIDAGIVKKDDRWTAPGPVERLLAEEARERQREALRQGNITKHLDFSINQNFDKSTNETVSQKFNQREELKTTGQRVSWLTG